MKFTQPINVLENKVISLDLNVALTIGQRLPCLKGGSESNGDDQFDSRKTTFNAKQHKNAAAPTFIFTKPKH